MLVLRLMKKVELSYADYAAHNVDQVAVLGFMG